MHVKLREGDLDAVCVEYLLSLVKQIKVYGPVVGSVDPGTDLDGDLGLILRADLDENVLILKDKLVSVYHIG